MKATTTTLVVEETRRQVSDELQPVLSELIDLTLQGKQLHWNVTGRLFKPLHEQLDEIVNDARSWSDDVAERMVALGMPAAGQAPQVAQESTLDPLSNDWISDERAVELMAQRVEAVARRVRSGIDRLGEVDLPTQDLLIEVARGLEKHLWMLRAQLG